MHLYPTGEGEVIAVATLQARDDREALLRRATELQQQYKFRYPLPQLLEKRADHVDVSEGAVLTDDFTPADLYNSLRANRSRRK